MTNNSDKFWMGFCMGLTILCVVILTWEMFRPRKKKKKEARLAKEVMDDFLKVLKDVPNNDNRILDCIYTIFNTLLRGAAFADVDEILDRVEVSKIQVDPLLAMLLVTYAAKSKLVNYKPFYKAVNNHLLTVVNDVTGQNYTEEEALALLIGLSP